MHAIRVDDINEALHKGLSYLEKYGQSETSRNGRVLVSPTPVTTVYTNPTHRVLMDPVRDANPFFHLFEALWILKGREDVAFLQQFNSKIADFSDDGIKFHAPYGHRLRHATGNMRGKGWNDQIETAVEMLKKDPLSRRVVMSIWDAQRDLNRDSKDLPCNDMIMLRIRKQKSGSFLDITVNNRSNDVIWGAYGANAVQFSVLQEYMAAKIGVEVGKYYQISNNYHAYDWNPYFQAWKSADDHSFGGVSYSDFGVVPTTIFDARSLKATEYDMGVMFDSFDTLAGGACSDYAWINMVVDANLNSPFFYGTAVPMLKAWTAYKERRENTLSAFLGSNMNRGDWLAAGAEWIQRRLDKKGA